MRLIREAETNLSQVFPSTNDKSHRIYQFLRRLKLVREKVHILTDKTNTFRIVDTDKYVYWMEKKLREQATQITRDELVKIYKDAKNFYKDNSWLISHREKEFIK